MFVQVINIGLNLYDPEHAVVIRTDEPDEFMAWVEIACPGHENLRRITSLDERFESLKYCIRFDLSDRDLMMFKLRWK